MTAAATRRPPQARAAVASGAFASGLAETFLPAILLKDAEFALRFLAAITTVSAVLFLSGCIPCILATRPAQPLPETAT